MTSHTHPTHPGALHTRAALASVPYGIVFVRVRVRVPDPKDLNTACPRISLLVRSLVVVLPLKGPCWPSPFAKYFGRSTGPPETPWCLCESPWALLLAAAIISAIPVPLARPRKFLPAAKVKNYSPGYMEQAPSRSHEASLQSGLGVGCKLYSSSKNLYGLSLRAQARGISISLSFSVLGFPRSCLPRVAR